MKLAEIVIEKGQSALISSLFDMYSWSVSNDPAVLDPLSEVDKDTIITFLPSEEL